MQEKNIVNSILLETLQPAPKSVNLRGSERERESDRVGAKEGRKWV